MVEISPLVSSVINFSAFGALFAIGGILLYVGKTTHIERKITLPWVNLAFGTFMIGLNYLLQAIFVTTISGNPVVAISSYLLIIGGVAMTLTSFMVLYFERANEINVLRKRHDELKEITERLRRKYLSRELPEEELRKLDTDIVRELAEIEVKLDKLKRGKSTS